MRIFYFPSLFASLAARFPKACLIVISLLTLLSAGFAARIELRNDFVELLPDDMPEVRVIRNVLYKSGGLGYQAVMVSSKDLKKNRAYLKALRWRLSRLFRPANALPFADAIQDQYERLGANLRDIFHYSRNPSDYWKLQIQTRIKHFSRAPMVEYSFDGYDLTFFERHQLLMLESKDLNLIYERLRRKIQYEVRRRQLGDLSLLEPSERPKDPGIDLRDIQAKYDNKLKQLPSRIEVKEGDLWYGALIIRPRGIATDLLFSKPFIEILRNTTKELRNKPEFLGVSTDLIGGFSANLREFEGISRDLFSSIASTVVLLIVLLMLFFRRWRIIWIIPVPLLMGFVWTHAFAYVAIGYLNTVTSFIGVLLLGLGIDYGIYLTHRYYQERALGRSPEEAVHEAFYWTGKGVSTAAITTAAGFFALLLCRFRGFSEFGVIAGMGVILCLIAMSTVLPAILVLMERWKPARHVKSMFDDPKLHRGFPASGLFVCAALGVVIWSFYALPQVGFEYSLRKLNYKDKHTVHESVRWQRFDKIFPQSGMNPVVFFLPEEQQVRAVQDELERRGAKERKEKSGSSRVGIRRTLSAFQFVPEQQTQKVRLLQKIRDLLKRNNIDDWVEDDPKLEKIYREYRSLLNAQSFGPRHLPLYMQRDLVLYDKDDFEKISGYMVVVVSGYDLSDGKQAGELHDRLKGIRAPQQGHTATLQPSGEPIIFGELLRVVNADSIRAIVVSLLAVLLLVWLDLRSFKLTMLSLWPLFTGLLGISVLLVLFDIRLNMFNMVVLPALLGINVDAGVHMLHRYREVPEHGTLGVLVELTGAVFMASLTTVISFATLVFAHHQGMKSVGTLAIVGLVSGLIGSLVFLPALMEMIFRRFPLKRFLKPRE